MPIRIQHKTRGPLRLSPTQGLIYCAGLFDGEGCIHIARQVHKTARRGYVYRLRVSISQNHQGTLIDFQDLIGIEGLMYQTGRAAGQNKDCYQLTFDGQKGAQVLNLMFPYLLRKGPEAKAAMQFQSTCEIGTHFGPNGCPAHVWKQRDAFYLKLKSLK